MADFQWQALGEPGAGGRMDALKVNPNDPNHILLSGDILGSAVSFDGGRSWQPTTGFDGWAHSDFTFAPNQDGVPAHQTEVWIGTASGIYKSNDGGQTWAAKNTGLPEQQFAKFGFPAMVEKVLFDPNDADVMYAFAGDHRQHEEKFPNLDLRLPNYGKIWKSTDGGESWSDQGMGELPGNIGWVSHGGGAENGTALWAAVMNDGLWKSDDMGAEGTWVKIGGLPDVSQTNDIHMTSVVVDPTDADVVFVSIGVVAGSGNTDSGVGGVWRTTNGGQTWDHVLQGVDHPDHKPDFMSLDITADGQTLWAGDTSYVNGKGLYKSTDGGATWTQALSRVDNAPNLVKNDFATANRIGVWFNEISDADPDTVFGLTSSILLRTEDGGDTWYDSLNSDQESGLVRGNGYGGWVARNVVVNPYDPQMIVVQGMDFLLATISRDGGFSWDISQPGLPQANSGNDITFAKNGVMYIALGQGGNNPNAVIARSTDNGYSWDLLQTPDIPGGDQSIVADGVYTDPDDPNLVILSADGYLFKSENALAQPAAVTWQQLDVVPGTGFEDTGGIVGNPQDASTFYVTTSDGIYVTYNFGETFQASGDVAGTGDNGPDGRAKLTVDPSDPDVIYATSDAFGGSGLFRFDPNTGWEKIPLPTLADRWLRGVAVHPTDPDFLVAVTGQDTYAGISGGTGVYVSRDGGQTWAQENMNLPSLSVRSVTFTPDGQDILIGTGGRGFFRASVGADLRIEAEHLNVSAGIDAVYGLVEDATASGGYALAVDTYATYAAPDFDAPGVTYSFTLDDDWDADVALRVLGAGSLFYRFDQDSWQELDISQTSDWAWVTTADLDSSQLDVGRHSLHLLHARGDVQIDAIEVREATEDDDTGGGGGAPGPTPGDGGGGADTDITMSAGHNQTVLVDVMTKDFGLPGQAIRLTSISYDEMTALVSIQNGKIKVNPLAAAKDARTEEITYTVQDENGNTATGTLSVDVAARGASQAGPSIAFGHSGSSMLQGGKAIDRFVGGAGSDTFVFEEDGHLDIVYGFDDGTDLIGLKDLSFGDIEITQHRSTDTLITAGDTRMILKDQDVQDITINDFDLV